MRAFPKEPGQGHEGPGAKLTAFGSGKASLYCTVLNCSLSSQASE